jgi:hypothetical protein
MAMVFAHCAQQKQALLCWASLPNRLLPCNKEGHARRPCKYVVLAFVHARWLRKQHRCVLCWHS